MNYLIQKESAGLGHMKASAKEKAKKGDYSELEN